MTLFLDHKCSVEELSKKSWENIRSTPKVEITAFEGSNIWGKRGNITFYDILPAQRSRFLQEIEEYDEDEGKTDEDENIVNYIRLVKQEQPDEFTLNEEKNSAWRKFNFSDMDKILSESIKDINKEEKSQEKIKTKNNNSTQNIRESPKNNTVKNYIESQIILPIDTNLTKSPQEIPDTSPPQSSIQPSLNPSKNETKNVSITTNSLPNPVPSIEIPEKPQLSIQKSSKIPDFPLPKNRKIWGSNEGNNGFSYSIPESENCPINHVMVINPKREALTVPKDYWAIELKNGYVLAYTDKATYLPIVDFKLSESLPWFNPTERSITPGRKFYPLLKNSNNSGWQSSYSEKFKYDTRYGLVGKIDEYTLFKENGVWCTKGDRHWYNNRENDQSSSYKEFNTILNFTDNLPLIHNYGSFKEYEYNLYSRHYIPWEKGNEKWAKNGDIKIAQYANEYQSYLSHSHSVLYFMRRVGIFFAFLSILILLFISWCFEKPKDQIPIVGILIIILVSLFILFLFVYSGIIYFLIRNIKIHQFEYKQYSDNKWSDEYMNLLLNPFAERQSPLPDQLWHTLYAIMKSFLTAILLIFYTMMTIMTK